MIPVLFILLYARVSSAWMKKKPGKKTFTSNEKLKANRASETKEQMKERLRIGREKIDIPKITRGKEKVVRNRRS